MEEENKTPEIDWVTCRLGYDAKNDKVKLSCDDKDSFAKAVGMLMRVTLETTKDILVNESKKGENKE